MSRPRSRSKHPDRAGARQPRAPLAYDPTKTGQVNLTALLGSAAARRAPPVAAPAEPVIRPAPIQFRLGPLAVSLLEAAVPAEGAPPEPAKP